MKHYEITPETSPRELFETERELKFALLEDLTPREREYAQRKLAHAAFEQAQRAEEQGDE